MLYLVYSSLLNVEREDPVCNIMCVCIFLRPWNAEAYPSIVIVNRKI